MGSNQEREQQEELCEYELKRLERIRRNEAYFESLGLTNHKVKMMQQTTQKTKRNKKKLATAAASNKIKPGEERRSHRIKSNGSKSDDSKLMMLSYRNADDRVEIPVAQDDYYSGSGTANSESTSWICPPGQEASRPSKSFSATRRAISYYNDSEDFELTEEEKERLTKIDGNYLEKFQEFLVYHNKISEQNVRNVMRQVKKLVDGEGVRYESAAYGWKKPHQVFQKGTPVTPLSDFVELLELAQEAEEKWGRDHGNGWLLRHPLKKMLLFQQFCLQNPDFLGSECKLKDYYALDDENGTESDNGNGGDHEDENSNNSSGGNSDKENPVLEPPNKKIKLLLENKEEEYIGCRVAKEFEDGIYHGSVQSYCPKSKYWHVKYDDDDEEDMDVEELAAALGLHKQDPASSTRRT